MRRRMCRRLFVAVAAMWSAVAMTGNVTHAADFRLGVVNSTFVAKIGDRIIINAFPPGDPSVGGTLTDP